MGELVTGLLWDLARGHKNANRRIIICVIHTPSSRMWQHFSHVCLLATGGKMAYHGSRAELMPFLMSLGYKMPEAYNPSDFALEVVSAT
jgi:ATP-binding cassette, subfamily G (WHITE), member 2